MIHTDSIAWMRAIAKMAGMGDSPIRRMVLVLDVGDFPRLYVESFLDRGELEDLDNLPPITQEVEDTTDSPIIVNTTSMQNEKFVTKSPLR